MAPRLRAERAPRRSAGYAPLLILVAIVWVLALAPTIAAQAPQNLHVDAEVQPHEGALLGGQAPIKVPLQIHVHCDAPSIFLTPVEIGHRLEASSEQVTAVLSEASRTLDTELIPCLATETTVSYDLEATLILPFNLPAYEQLEFRLYAELYEEEHRVVEWSQQVAFQGEVVIDAHPENLWVRTGDNATSEVQIVNRANAPLTVHIDVEKAPAYGTLTLPSTLEVPYTDSGDLALFEIGYERTAPGTDRFTINLVPSPTADPEQKMPASTLTFQVEDTDLGMETEESPAPVAFIVIAAAALAMWRKNDNRQ